MGKNADVTVVQKTPVDTLQEQGKPQKVIAERVGCSQSAASKHIHGKLTGREKCGGKRCTGNRDDRNLERIANSRTWGSFTRTGLRLETVHQEPVPRARASVKPLLNQRQRQKCLTWGKEKKYWTFAKWSEVLSSDESKGLLLSEKTLSFSLKCQIQHTQHIQYGHSYHYADVS
uniref:HTH psq-type domain-containing protein n=1 Tax=Esox lucius TaxID=8010 RepID=A0AAY5KU12_ESOLU